MELLNATPLITGYTQGIEPSGREHIVVVVKGTYQIPSSNGGVLSLVEPQCPLVMADTFTGEPGLSAPVYEADFPLVKPRCDVLLHGSAYAPLGRETERVTVGLSIGSVQKRFDVVGDRVWKGAVVSRPSRPRPFTMMPISYDRAWGGVDVHPDKPDQPETFLENPVGVGFHPINSAQDVEGRPLPNSEELRRMISSPSGTYRPMSFGPIGRSWLPRYPHAGTYDQQWLDEVFPFLPADFDSRYYLSAPPDQQLDAPRGGEQVTLENLTPEGLCMFSLPALDVPIEFTDAWFHREEVRGALDTIIIEPDERRVQLVWRASAPLRRSMRDIRQVVVGRMPQGWYRARALGKTYYPSLKHLTAVKRGET